MQALDAARGDRFELSPDHLIRQHRLTLPFDGHPAERSKFKKILDQFIRVMRHLDRAGLRCLFHTGCQIDGIPQRRVLHPQVRADRADHHQPRVDPDAYVEIDMIAFLDLLTVGFDGFHDIEPGQYGAARIVFVCDWRTEERQERIAHESCDRSLIAVDRFDHVRKSPIHDLRPILGVQLLGGSRRAFEIAEQHSHDTALADHPALVTCRLQLLHQLFGDVLAQLRPNHRGRLRAL